jgi:hypothetical protein
MIGPHGHVTPRPDGMKARCGGPAMCAQCAREKAAKDAQDAATMRQEAPKPLPPKPAWPRRAWWLLYAYARWPLDVHRLKREGWARTGWMAWESPPEQAPGDHP